MKRNYIWPIITMGTSLEEIQKIHKRIWDYVIKYGKKPATPYFCDCAICEYATLRGGCIACPAIWDSKGGTCVGPNSLYSKWDTSRRKDIAIKIRDIPFETDF